MQSMDGGIRRAAERGTDASRGACPPETAGPRPPAPPPPQTFSLQRSSNQPKHKPFSTPKSQSQNLILRLRKLKLWSSLCYTACSWAWGSVHIITDNLPITEHSPKRGFQFFFLSENCSLRCISFVLPRTWLHLSYRHNTGVLSGHVRRTHLFWIDSTFFLRG